MDETRYKVMQRKYCITSILCGVIIVLIMALSLMLKPILNDLASNKFDVFPGKLYKMIAPFALYVALGILILSTVSMFVDIRLKMVWRVCIVVVGVLALFVYLFVTLTPFVGAYPFRQELLPVFKILNFQYYDLVQQMTAVILGASLFVAVNK